MLLSVPAVISCVVTVLAFLVGVAAIAVSSGPGWREVRWFGVAAFCASAYAICALQTTLPDVDLATRAFFGRLGGASASLLVGSWFVYFTHTEQRDLVRWERAVVGIIVAIGLLWMIPGVCRTSEAFVRTVSWLGVSYTTTRPTAVGTITYGVLLVVTCVLNARIFVSFVLGKRRALAYFLAVSTQLVCGVNDALAAMGKLQTPYMLDVGQFVVVLAVGTTLIARFVAGARALERSSNELRAAQSELVRRERLAALGELSAVVAHEVRNPVTVIFTAIGTLRKQAMSADATPLLDIVNEEAERLKRVVGELLEFARPRALSLASVAPAELLEGAVEAAVAGTEGDRRVEIDRAVDMPTIAADEQLLRQALINLVTNALQAAGRTAPVHVRARTEGQPPSHVTFEVTDDGDGISKDVEDKLFTPFFTTRASGTGLGLPIVKRIAESHGGEIAWHAETPRGVTFALKIPIARRAPRPG